MDVIYSTLFEGDTTWLLPKITYISCLTFWFFDFFALFQIFWKYWKRQKVLYSYRLGGDKCQGENKLVLSNETYLCSMQRNMCRITKLGGKFPPSKKWGIKMQRIYKKGSAWLDMRQAWAKLIIKVKKVKLRLNKARKNHDNEITTWHIQGSPKGNGQHKVQEEYEALTQRHNGTKMIPIT